LRAGGQGRAFAALLGSQRLWRILLLSYFCQIPPLPLTPAIKPPLRSGLTGRRTTSACGLARIRSRRPNKRIRPSLAQALCALAACGLSAAPLGGPNQRSRCGLCTLQTLIRLMTEDEFFAGHSESQMLFQVLCDEIDQIGPTERQVSKSQIAFRRRKAFAWVWRPGQYLRGQTAPLVLTFSFRYRDASPRWKEIAKPRPGYFTHHLELYSANDIDAEVAKWLQQAWKAAA
jgi:hypothetical protein